ncbi:hypothetical protein BV22DRAFT_1052632 [Leucogyrophana mollusca]|uniref:Uncharacterized protein n=1 Tax=Leucogyrophana mollusca TaxID=85980 RepID=A0ACB8AUI0_9AGAM|nr:hypothetical protein BV22DRAFT_1052632 [Leucogyrophana mollusca]
MSPGFGGQVGSVGDVISGPDLSRKRKRNDLSLAPDRRKRFADETTVLGRRVLEKIYLSKALQLQPSFLCTFKCTQRSRKRKAGDDVTDERPSKRPASLIFSENIAYIWTLPTELLFAIASYLSGKALHSLTQVCRRLYDIAGPMFMKECGLQPSGNGAVVAMKGNAYDALMVWRRSPSFPPPQGMWWCSLHSSDSHRQINQLRQFCSTVSITAPSHSVHLSCWGNVDPHVLLPLLRTITCMGSSQIDYLGLSPHTPCLAGIDDAISEPTLHTRLHEFRPCSSIFFTSPILHYTLLTMRSPTLRNLSLERTGLSASQWARLLPQLEIPNLVQIRIADSCTVTTFAKFLRRHPLVEDIFVSWDASGHYVSAFKKPFGDIRLPYLCYLSGPAHYMDGLIQRLEAPPRLFGLSLSFERAGTWGIPFVKEIIRCVKMCNTVDHLSIKIPNRSLPATCFALGGNEPALHHVVSVSISCWEKSALSTSHGDDILVLISKWLPVFSNLKRLHLKEKLSRSRKELVSLLRRIGPSSMEIKIESNDLEGVVLYFLERLDRFDTSCRILDGQNSIHYIYASFLCVHITVWNLTGPAAQDWGGSSAPSIGVLGDVEMSSSEYSANALKNRNA